MKIYIKNLFVVTSTFIVAILIVISSFASNSIITLAVDNLLKVDWMANGVIQRNFYDNNLNNWVKLKNNYLYSCDSSFINRPNNTEKPFNQDLYNEWIIACPNAQKYISLQKGKELSVGSRANEVPLFTPNGLAQTSIKVKDRSSNAPYKAEYFICNDNQIVNPSAPKIYNEDELVPLATKCANLGQPLIGYENLQTIRVLDGKITPPIWFMDAIKNTVATQDKEKNSQVTSSLSSLVNIENASNSTISSQLIIPQQITKSTSSLVDQNYIYLVVTMVVLVIIFLISIVIISRAKNKIS